MLYILAGKSGTGKTSFLYNKIDKIVSECSSKEIYFLVPEQYEFETEKQLLIHMKAQSFSKINVTTFTKISSEINALYGTPKELADDIVKKTSAYLAIKAVLPKLKYYVKTAKKPAFASIILNVISMLKSSNITPNILAEKVGGMLTDSALYRKLWDISLIFSAYNAIIEKSYNELPDELINASDNARANDYFADKIFIVDGFDSFSGGQFAFLKVMFDECFDAYLSVTTDIGNNSYLFYSTNKLISKLKNLDNKIIAFDEFKRFNSKELLFLADNFQQDYTKNNIDNCENIQIISCDDYYKEAEFVASKIQEKIIQGHRYKDFVILSANAQGYLPAFESTFEKYEIPIFFDIPQPISFHPLTKQVFALFDVISEPNTENILRYIKSGFVRILNSDNKFSTLTLYQINLLEEFVYTWDLDGESWLKSFEKISVVNGEEEVKFKKENVLREKIIVPIIELKNELSNKNGAEITEIIINFLIEKIDIKGAIKSYCYINSDDDFSDELNPLDNVKVNEYHQVWELILSVFEGMHKSFANQKINFIDYFTLLKNIMFSTNCAKPPQFIDTVLLGSVGRTRAAEVKFVFIIGCNDRVFPKSIDIGTTFSENEIEMMNSEGIDLGIDRKSRYSQQIFSAYRALTLPSTQLYLSFSAMSSSGESLDKSDVIDEMISMFSELRIQKCDDFGEEFYNTNVKILKQRLARLYRENSTAKATLLKVIHSKEPEFVKNINEVLSLQSENSHDHYINNTSYTERAFSTNRISATRFEELSKCNFKFFCNNVLDVSTPNKRGLTPMESGNVIHFILQNILEFYSKYHDDFQRFINADTDEIHALIKVNLEKYKEISLIDNFNDSKRFDYIYNLFLNVAYRLLASFQDEFSVSKFKPKYFEASIFPDQNSSIENGFNPISIQFTTKNNTKKEYYITGKIDRIDVLENDKNSDKHLRVIDYKSGDTNFSLSAVKSGINTQMLIYLFSACDEKSNYKPAGVLYYKVGESAPDATNRDIDDSDKAKMWYKSHRKRGLISSDEIVRIDQDNLKTHIANKINATKQLKIFQTTERKPNEIESIKNYCISFAENKLKNFLNGEIKALPVETKSSSPCAYCDYISFCRKNNNKIEIDTSLDEYMFNELDDEITKMEE